MRGLVASPFNVISKSMDSHRAAQGVIYASQLNEAGKNVDVCMSGHLYKEDWNEYDELYIYHGNDWSGSLNLFGGLQNYSGIYNFVNFSRFNGKVYSLAIDMVDYYAIMKEKLDKTKEKGQEYNSEWNEIDWDNLKRMCTEAETLDPNDLNKSRNIAIGDSHAICMYRPGWQNISVPFKTLHGALKEGLESFLPKGAYECIEFYFGNIDIRHHLCRQDNPEEATKELVRKYIEQARALANFHNATVRLYEPLPIENPSRKIPKTGWHKGAPFCGDWASRNFIRKLFREEIRKNQYGGVELYEWVGEMINNKGELDFEYMEKPQSVHLSRRWYPHWQGYEYSHAPFIDYTPIPEGKKKTNSLEDFFG